MTPDVTEESSIDLNQKPKTKNKKLQNAIDQLYRPNVELHEMKRTIYKAIGWVSQAKDRRTIPSYFQSYGMPDTNKKQDFESLFDYLKMAALHKGDAEGGLFCY